METRDKVEPKILRKINKGNILFWWDKWIPQGNIKTYANLPSKPGNINVREFFTNHGWNIELLQDTVPQRVLDEIMQIKIGRNQIQDQAIWTPNPQGSFTCSSAYQLLRKRRESSPQLAKIWNKHLPFKISFATWRLLKGRVPEEETMDHVFANSNTAKKVLFQVKVSMGQKYSQMNWDWTWNIVCNVVEDYKTRLKSVMVLWEPPDSNQ
ncbi:uncharacterized protein [Nicotiana tomentosiformis]|uniref:uncharacterized protein n=1 Tax=Nicotiana tomentosiformis TaxID=4098 RepID=UPI00388CDD8C